MAKIKVDVKGKLKKWKKAKLQRLEENQKSKVDPWAFLQDADDEADDDTLDDVAPPALVPPDEEIGWQAQAGAQKIFLSCPLWEVLLHGNRGGGKTDALIVDFLQHVDVGWGAEWRGILFRETYPQLDDVRKKCRKLIPRIFPTATFNKNENTWSFPKGEQLLLRHMRVAEDYQGYHGHEYPWQGWEELCNWATPDCYKLMMSCSRSSVDPARRDKHGRPLPRKIRATTNPYGKGMNWVKRRFQLPHMSDKVILEEETFDGESGAMKEIRPRIAISASFKENLKLSKAEPNYMDNIKQAARNPAELAAWVSGSWDIQSGGMFDDLWESGVHVVQPFEIPSNWRINRSFDWGSSRPASVGWWAESDGTDVKLRDGSIRKTVRGDIFRIAEWYIAIPGQNKGLRLTPSQITEGILVREMAMGLRDKNTGVTRVGTGPADSAIWDTSGGPSIADQMKQPVRIDGRMFAGLVWEKADKSPGSRKNGCEAIRQRLKDAKKSEAGAREKPGLFIFNLCKDWIENVPILPRDDKDPDDVDTDSNDHQFDETRYRIMTPRRITRYGRTEGI